MDSLPPELVASIVLQCDPLDVPNLLLASRLFHVLSDVQKSTLYKRHMEASRRDLIFYRRLMRPRQVIRAHDGQRESVDLTMEEKLDQFVTCTQCGALVVKERLGRHHLGPWCAHRRHKYVICATCHLAKPASHFKTKSKCLVCDRVGRESITCVYCLEDVRRMDMWNHKCHQ